MLFGRIFIFRAQHFDFVSLFVTTQYEYDFGLFSSELRYLLFRYMDYQLYF